MKKNRKFRSIRVKLIFLLSFSVMLALFLSTTAIISNTYSSTKKEYIVSLENITNILANNLSASIEFDDTASAKSLLKTLKIDDNVEGAFIYKEDKLFTSFIRTEKNKDILEKKLDLIFSFYDVSEKIKYSDDDHIFISVPVILDHKYLATFCLVANTKGLNENVIEQVKVESAVSVIVLLISILIALRLQRGFTRPILQLKSAMQEVGKNNNYHIRVDNKYNDEYAILFDGFNNMLQKIDKQKIELENYMATLNDTIEEKTKDIKRKNMQLENLMHSFNRNIIFSRTDLKGVITEVSEAFCIISGYKEEELLGQPHSIVRHPDTPGSVFQEMWESLKQQACISLDMENRKKDGSSYWVHAKLEPDYDVDGNHIGYSALRVDTTAKKKLEELSVNLEKKVFERTQNLEDAKIQIEEIHKHTKESIEYASLIQSSLIPESELFRKYFKDSFALWRPKDVVGGDIYLFEELRDENECLLMVIDCTGHGVPGAFVTMLVKAIERQIIGRIKHGDEVVSPAKILSIFNSSMKHLLKQENEGAISNAGFDGQILYYNKREQIIKIASARNEVFYFQEDELHVIKGDRHSVGYKDSDVNFVFKEHTIDVSKETTLYISSDGYWDQNGGKKNLPFGKKRFKELLNEVHNESMADQQEIFLYTHQEYVNHFEQNDDVTIVGIKI